MKRLAIFAVGALALAGASFWFLRPDYGPVTVDGLPMVEIILPASLTAEESEGKALFDTHCALCHGTNAVGQSGFGPPLVHIIYEPSHHGDKSFHLAAAQGVRAHHWDFGDMPAVGGVTRADVDRVIAYVRRLQRENGIF